MESASVAKCSGTWAANFSLLEKGQVSTGSGLKKLAVAHGKHTFTLLSYLASLQSLLATSISLAGELSPHQRCDTHSRTPASL